MTEEKKNEMKQTISAYLDTLGEEKDRRIEQFTKRRKISVLLVAIFSGLMAIAAGVLTGITCVLEALQGTKERIVIAVITSLIGTILVLCTVASSFLFKKVSDKERTKEDKLADYMETKLETLYKEAVGK